MDIKLELLQKSIYKYIRDMFETYQVETGAFLEGQAVMTLNRIKLVLSDKNLSDFEVVEEIVNIMEENNIYCGGRHDF